MSEGLVRLPDGRIYFDMPYRIDQIPKHFHCFTDWENDGQEGERCSKCGLVRLYPQPARADYVQPPQIHNPHIYDPDTLSEYYAEQAKIIKESER